MSTCTASLGQDPHPRNHARRDDPPVTGGLCDVRDAGDEMTLGLYGQRKPALVLRQDDHAVSIDLANVKALEDGAPDPSEVPASGAADVVR